MTSSLHDSDSAPGRRLMALLLGCVAGLALRHDLIAAPPQGPADLDTRFGAAGKVTFDFGQRYDAIQAVVIQSDGKILLVGHTDAGNGFDVNFALARLNPDGTLDATFDGDGKVTTDLGGRDMATAVKVQRDGKILVAGSTTNNVGAQGDFALVRYNADGSLDAGFGNGGIVKTDFGGGGLRPRRGDRRPERHLRRRLHVRWEERDRGFRDRQLHERRKFERRVRW